MAGGYLHSVVEMLVAMLEQEQAQVQAQE